MISVFKNFHERPDSLNGPLFKEYAESLLNLFNEDPSSPIFDRVQRKFHKVFRSNDVLNALKKLYHNKCAYCEQKTDLGIDHYRPKSKYPWLMLEWSNLLPICRNCNVTLHNRFDVKGKELSWADIEFTQYPLLANSPHLKKELPSLIHPEVDSPENHITFDLNGYAIGRTDRGRYTIEALNLNRDTLFIKRKEALEEIKIELREITTAFFAPFRLRGDFIVNNMPDQFKAFFNRFLRLQDSAKEFSGLFSAIWQEDSFLAHPYFTDEEYNHHILNQLIIWKQLHQNRKQGLKKNDLPKIAITGFELQNYEGIRHIKMGPLPVSTQWIFLTGENGFGKTSILKALALGLTGKKLVDNEARFKIDITAPSNIRLRHSIMDNGGYDSLQYQWQSDRFKSFYRLATYGPNRTSISQNFTNPDDQDILDSLFGDKTALLNVERFLIDTYDRPETKEKYDKIVNAILNVIPQLADIRIDGSKDILEVKYYERSNDPELNFQEVSFDNLATGIRSVVALVGDMICRFMLNQKDTIETSEIEGLVIIDELDIHLHPKWQRSLPELLSTVFPKVQFIASTHSPIPLLGAPKGSVFLKVSRNVAKGIQLERLTEIEQNLANMLPNIIYTSELFDMETIRSVANKNDSKIMTQDNSEEAEDFIEGKKKYLIDEINDETFLQKLKDSQR